MSQKSKLGLIEKIVIPYLDATEDGLSNIEEIQFLLFLRAKQEQKNAAEIFKLSYTDNINEIKNNPQYPYFKILKLLIQPEEYSSYLEDYQKWLHDYQISNNLLYFLEFLAYKNKHRLSFFIKMLYKTNPPYHFLKLYFLLTLTSFSLGFIIYFQPQYWLLALDWLKYSGPEIFFGVLHHILLPQNVVILSSLITLGLFISSLITKLKDKTTSNNEKTLSSIELVISTSLNLFGQLFCFLNYGYMSPAAAYLFITSALFMACWSFLSFNRQAIPLKSSSENVVEIDNYFSEINFNQFKKNEFGLNSVYLILVSASTAIGLYFLNTIPAINLFAVFFQFSLNMVKNSIIEQLEYSYTAKTQKEICIAHETHYFSR